MRIIRFAAIVALLAVSLTASMPVAASTITQLKWFGGSPNYTSPLTFDKFNVPSATLNSIKLTCSLWIDGGYLIVDNDNQLPTTVTVALGAYGNLTSPDVTLKDASNNPTPPQVSCTTGNTFNLGAENGDGPGNVDLNPPDGACHNGGYAADSKSGFIGPAYFAGYIGAGSYVINANVFSIANYGGVQGVEGAFAPVASKGNLLVTYDYDLVPEPSGIVALLAGMGGLLGVGFRRRK